MLEINEAIEEVSSKLATQAHHNHMSGSMQPFHQVDYETASMVLQLAYQSPVDIEDIGEIIREQMHKRQRILSLKRLTYQQILC